MSEASSILAEFLVAGASIRVDHGYLVVDAPPDAVTPEMLRSLAANKTELISMIEDDRGCSPAEGKAARLNRLFQELGVTGQPGRITAATVLHGETQRAIRVNGAAAPEALSNEDSAFRRHHQHHNLTGAELEELAESVEVIQARRILNLAGCRIIPVNGNIEFGICPDQDSPEIRAALRTLRHDQHVRYLDKPGIPAEYTKSRAACEADALRVLPEVGETRQNPGGPDVE